MIEEAFEAEYNIRRRHPESPQHYARYAADSAAARAALDGQLDLRYGEAVGETLDFFAAARADAPLFFFATAAIGERSTKAISALSHRLLSRRGSRWRWSITT